jgi:hypothetical protein
MLYYLLQPMKTEAENALFLLKLKAFEAHQLHMPD